MNTPPLLLRCKERYLRKKRFAEIAAALPEAIDLMVVVMQAGLDFQVALAQYLERAPKGALRDELSRLQAEFQMGVSRSDALRHMRERVPEPSLQETVRAILQGIEMGASLAPVLRTQAQALRRRRAFDAEKRAAVAPIKLLFPLFAFIFPTIFIVLLGPVALSLLRSRP